MKLGHALTDRQQNIKHFLIVFLINLLALSPLIVFSHIHYSIDSYGLTENWTNVEWHIGGFRYFAALITFIFSALGHNPILNPIPDIIFFIIVVSLSVTVLSFYIIELFSIPRRKIVGLIVNISLLITACNVWYSDLLTFSESISLSAIGFLLCFIGVYLYANCESIICLLLSSIAFVCAAATTQQFVAIFAIYSILILTIKQTQNEKKSIKELIGFYIKPVLFIAINSIIYYFIGVLLQRLMNINPNSRVSMNMDSVTNNIIYYIKNQHSFLKGRGFFSTEILTICYMLVIVAFAVSLIAFWRKTKQTAKTAFIGLSFVVAYFSAFLPGIVSTSHSTRALCALFSVFALFAIGAIALYQNRGVSVILTCILFLVFALNIYKTMDMGINQIVSNTNEATYADNIAYAIDKYEQTDKVSVTSIGICYDKHGDTDAEALYVDYAIEPLLQMHIGRDIKYIQVPDSVANTYFSNKDWTSYDADEQIVFDKNIAYVCVY